MPQKLIGYKPKVRQIGMSRMSFDPYLLYRLIEIENRIRNENRDLKIESLLNMTDYVEKTKENDDEWKKLMKISNLLNQVIVQRQTQKIT